MSHQKDMEREVLARFGSTKSASLATVLPAIALPAIGTFLGARAGGRWLGGNSQAALRRSEDIGRLVGGITGGISGQVLRELASRHQSPDQASTPIPYTGIQASQDDPLNGLYGDDQPLGAPFDIDPSSKDIPPWALAGAQLIRPAIQAGKTAALEGEAHGAQDVILGDIMGPGYPLMEGAREDGVPGALKHLAGSVTGTAAGGLLGYGLGQLLPHASIWGLPLSSITSGLGATIGGLKGLQAARHGFIPAMKGQV